MAKGLEVELHRGKLPPAASGVDSARPVERESLRRGTERRPAEAGSSHECSLGHREGDTTVHRRPDAATADRASLESKRALDDALGRQGPAVASTGPRVGPAAAVACAGTRGPDGLTAAERRAVASDSSAPPALPPTRVPPRPEPARAALGKMLEGVELDGAPLDVATLASSVRRPLGETCVPPGRADSARSLAAARPDAADRARAGSGATPSPAGGLAAARPDAAAKLALATRGTLTAAGAAGSARAGAHDGVESGVPLDAMHFNWDAFFSRFLLRATADAQAWRKVLAELRHLTARTGLAMQQADADLLEFRQSFERAQALGVVAKSMVGLAGARAGGSTRASASGDPGSGRPTAVGSSPSTEDSAALETLPSTGDSTTDGAAPAEGGPGAAEGHPDVGRRLAEAITSGVDELPGSSAGLAERAARRTVVLAQSDRDRLDALVRASMGRAQGMLAQLARLLGASRGR